MQILTYDPLIRCVICDKAVGLSDGCAQCGGNNAGAVILAEKDCTRCKNFTTSPMTYPSGSCKKYGLGCGIGFFCAGFEV